MSLKILSSTKLKLLQEQPCEGQTVSSSPSVISALSPLQSACREIAALHALSHPGIARLVSAFKYTDGYYLVLEYASQG